VFGSCSQAGLELSPAGLMIRQTWIEIPSFYEGVSIDEFIVMPDHFHGIVVIQDQISTCQYSLCDVVQRFKSLTTHRYIEGVHHQHWQPFPGRLWHRNYYERIIRDTRALDAIRKYIRDNPIKLQNR
jgi:REP element-mobilizing transposase RayT